MRLPPFEYHAPTSLSQCARLLQEYGTDAVLAAGGTDLFVRMKQGLVTGGHLISLSVVQEMNTVTADKKKGLFIGAGTRLSVLVGSPLIRKHAPVLAQAASLVATTQIRNMATLGGNLLQETRCFYYNRSHSWRKAVPACFKRGGDLCHVVPRGKRCLAVYQGDLAPSLIAQSATAILFQDGKEQETPLKDLFTGEGKSPFREEDRLLLAGVRVPPTPKAWHGAYRKYRLRDGIDFPLAGVAVEMNRNTGKIDDLIICLTGVSSRPVLVSKAQELAQGKDLTPALISSLALAAEGSASPAGNLEGSPSRRKLMVRLMTEEILSAMA